MKRSTSYALLLAVPQALTAQAVIRGTVREDSTGRPLAGAEIVVSGLGPRVTTDLKGEYLITGLEPGTRVVLIRMVGYRPVRLSLRIAEADTIWANVLLVPSAQQLDPVEVTAEADLGEYHLRSFDENRRMGFGKFLDSTYLRRWESSNLGDLLQRFQNVTLLCEPGFGYYKPCYPAVKRGPHGRPCLMRVFVDGKPGMLSDVRTGWKASDLDAVEIYRSAAEIPAEYNSASSACGVVAFWTRKN